MVEEIVTPPAGTPEGGVAEPAAPAEPTPPAETPPAEPKPAVAPQEDYNIKLPENSLLSQAQAEEIVTYCKGQGFSKEQTQAQVERENKVVSGVVESYNVGGENWTKQVTEWEQQSLADPQLGNGDKAALMKNAELGTRVLQKFGDEELTEGLLKRSGAGSHPAVLRFISKVGKAMGEDKLVLPGASPVGKKPIEDVLYGTPPPKQ